MLKYPDYLSKLISFLRKFPSIGFKTAEKIAFELLDWEEDQLMCLSEIFANLPKLRSLCSLCCSLKDHQEASCCLCENHRDPAVLCIVALPKDVFALERSKIFKGHYFVLGNLLSPITGQQISAERMQLLEQRLNTLQPKEIILALDTTLEGDATALYLKQAFPEYPTTRLALGIPIGLSFDYIDPGTLSKAFLGRNPY